MERVDRFYCRTGAVVGLIVLSPGQESPPSIESFSPRHVFSHSPILNSTQIGRYCTMTQDIGNSNDHLVQSPDPDHPSNLIPDLCRKFYNWGWVTGTGGGVG